MPNWMLNFVEKKPLKSLISLGASKPINTAGSSAPTAGAKTSSNQRSHTPQSVQSSSKSDLPTSSVPPSLKMKVAGEIMQTQTNTVPVMIEK